MTTVRFLAELERLGVTFRPEGDRLRCSAPAGVLSPAVRAELALRKAEILSHLRAVPRIVPVARDRDLPLSYAQQRLWVLHRLDPESPFYNCPISLRIRGPLDLPALEASLREVVRRHETLRTRFVEGEDGPVQILSPDAGFQLALADLIALPADLREDALRQAVRQETRRPFDLSRDLLLRALVVNLADGEGAAILTLHHIVCDGWSMGLLLREVGQLYGDLAARRPSRLPELPIQCADFAVWQRAWLAGERLQEQLGYWVERLAGAPPLLKLPTDRPRPVAQRFRGGSKSRLLPASFAESIRVLGRCEEASLFMTLLAAFKALLHAYTGLCDLCIGSPVAGRNRAEVEGLIGFFANMLVLRTDMSGDPSFRELLSRVRATSLTAFSHQDVPFDFLVETLRPDRDSSYGPLVQVAFDLQEVSSLSPSFPGLTLEPIGSDSGTSQFDLVLNAEDGPEGLLLCFEYDSDLFDGSTLVWMIEDLDFVLQQVLREPDVRLGALATALSARGEERRRDSARNLEHARLAKFRSIRRREPAYQAAEGGL
ncbi:MAG TPA: condensation domain-containing protein [Thermoanaerobaculia bacterium]|jgi:hypothetical protein|nr:condensation domain-containing protein [Thermoanaerobaculia bacterium]